MFNKFGRLKNSVIGANINIMHTQMFVVEAWNPVKGV